MNAELRPVGQIAAREVHTRLHSRGFRITTGLLVLAVVAIILVFHFVNRSSTPTVKIGVTSSAASSRGAFGSAAKDAGLDLRQQVVGLADGPSALQSGSLDALVSQSAPGHLQVLAKSDLSPQVRGMLETVAQQQLLAEAIRSLGGKPSQVGAQVAKASVQVKLLHAAATDPHRAERIGISSVVGVLTYLMLLISVQLTGQGVVEEKSNRIVELLLATVRPWQLLAGKVLGIGLATIGQVVLLAVAGAVTAIATGVVHLSAGVISGVAVGAVAWYLLGYFLYSLLIAAAASLVSRQEELAGVSAPITLLVVAGYLIGQTAIPSDPNGTAAVILSLIPLFAPVLMPMRIAYGVPPWQLVVAVLLMAIVLALVTVLAGRIYRNAVLRSGNRVSIRAALRGGD